MRNGAVDIYKFIFSWVIAFFHFYFNGREHFPMGMLGVEFFVMVAGVYFFMKWDRDKQKYQDFKRFVRGLFIWTS